MKKYVALYSKSKFSEFKNGEMATLNLILDKRRAKKDETYPLVFRIRMGRKFSDIRTGYSYHKNERTSFDNIERDLTEPKKLITQNLVRNRISS